MALKKGFSTKEWRRALEAAQQILQPQDEKECWWDVFTEEILPRLPANQLLTLKSVCENWNRTISSPYFIRLHLKIYNNQSRIRVLVPRYPGALTEYKINCDEETDMKIPYPPAIRTTEPTILGSCDGLLCVLLLAERGTRRNHSIAVYNPSTGKYLLLQSPLKHDYKLNCSWFGQHPCSGEYILVLGNLDDEIGVYKFNNRRSNLKKIHSTSYCIKTNCFYEDRVGTLLHGALHWPALRHDGSQVICAYHLDDNKYIEFSSPPLKLQRDFKLGVADGCLFAFFRDYDYAACVFELWIMKEYKLQQSWTKCANIEGEGFYNNKMYSPLGFFPNGNIFLYPNKLGFINYTFNDNKTLLLMEHEYHRSKAIMCGDSLVSPEIVGT